MKDKERTYFKDLEDIPKLERLAYEPIFYHSSKCRCESYKSIGGNMKKGEPTENEVMELCAEEEEKPELKLIGEDGNVFFILGKAVREGRRAGWSEEKIKKFQEEAMSGDYDHALQICMDYFDVT